ncbi:MAG: 30S ribosomal protein S1 [Thermodesulfovibrionales bacterium]
MDLKDEELEKLYADTFQGIETGSILTGKVVSKKPEGVIVDVGYKSEGMVRSSEFTEEELRRISEGDDIEVFVVSIVDSEGMVVLSKDRACAVKAWNTIEDCLKDNTPLEGTIVDKTKGGVFVDISGVKAFMPASHVDIRPVRDVDSFMGRKITCRVLKVNSKRSNVIVSRRLHLEEERSKKREETLKVLKEGALMKGVVKNITDYGVFVDLGGIDGLLHISDISWGRIVHPSSHFAIGDDIEVLVLSYDRENEKVTLGYKQKRPDPWSNVDEKYPAGTRVTGKVVSITDYGAFVEIEEDLEGLVHASEIEWASRPKHPSKYVSVGETVEALVLRADKDERRLSLSLKQLKPSPWELVAKRYKVGQTITGKVRGITEFGAFVGLPEEVDGLVHISDISWTKHIKHPSEVLRKGQTVDAVVLSIEPEKERIALGIKQLRQDPWINEIPQKFKLGDEVACKALRLTDFGIFVELEGEIEGLIYSSEVVDSGEPVKEGDELRARIIKIDLANRKLGLSMKNVRGPME